MLSSPGLFAPFCGFHLPKNSQNLVGVKLAELNECYHLTNAYKQLNHKILQVKVNTMRSSDILSQRPQHLCTGVYTSKLMRPVHSKVEVRLMHSDNYSRIYYESLSKSSNFSSYRLYVTTQTINFLH